MLNTFIALLIVSPIAFGNGHVSPHSHQDKHKKGKHKGGHHSIQPKRKDFMKNHAGNKKDAKKEWKKLGKDTKKVAFKESLKGKSRSEKKDLRSAYKKGIKDNKALLKTAKKDLRDEWKHKKKENKQALKDNKRDLRQAKKDLKKGNISQEQYAAVKGHRSQLKDERYNNKKEYLEKKWNKQAELGDGRLRGKKINRCLNANPQSAPECFQARAERRTKALSTAGVLAVGVATGGAGLAVGAATGGIAGGAKGYLDAKSGNRLHADQKDEHGKVVKSGRTIANKEIRKSTITGAAIGATIGGVNGGAASHGASHGAEHAAGQASEHAAQSSSQSAIVQTGRHLATEYTEETVAHKAVHGAQNSLSR